MSTASIGAVAQTGLEDTTSHDAVRDLDLDDFLKLMIAELQNQDPLDPMDNVQILQQVSQIREIGSNDKLIETLKATVLGQNVSTASSLLNRTVTALTDEAERVTGKVDRVSISGDVVKLHVGGHTIDLNNVSEIQPGENGDD